jgi:hypothetical protein
MENDREVPSTSVALMGSGVHAVTLASKLTVARGPGSFELSWRWRDQVRFQTLFGGFAALFGQLPNVLRHAPIVGGTVLALLGIAMYAAWAKGRARVRVEFGVIGMRAGPLAFQREIFADDVVTIAAQEPLQWFWIGQKGTPRHIKHEQQRLESDRWSVVATLKNGKTVHIVGRLLRREQAEEIASLIEREMRGGEQVG